MSALLPADADKFGKILGMLGSSHDGERASAALQATRFLTARDLQWRDIAEQLKRPPALIQPEVVGPVRWHQQFARRCLATDLIAWKRHEREFLEQMAERRSNPTDKQAAWLDALVDRLARKSREASNDCDF